LVVDTTAPAAPVVTSQTTNDTTPTVAGTAEANSTVSVVINGVTYTTTANGSGVWSVDVPIALADGTYTVSATATDAAGNSSPVGTGTLVVDTTAPAAPVVTSQVTSDTTPTVSGTAEAGSTVAVTINGVTYTTTADTNGNWSVTVPNGDALADGTYTVSATATDAAGNTSPVGTGTLVVDTTAPAAPVVTSQTTNDTTPTVAGTAEANSTVSVVINGITYTTTANGSGVWSVDVPTALADGTYTVSATATDVAGNTSPVGTGTLVVDTTAPAAPVVTSQVTSDTTPTVSGTAEAGSTVAVTINGVTYTTAADTNGNWSVTVPNVDELADGTYTVSARATDAAGNTSPVGTGTLVVDTTAPSAPVVASQTTSDTTPTVSGTAEAGSTVVVNINGVTYTTTADTNGNWSVTVPNGDALADGTYTVSATATDAAGNSSPVGTGTLVVNLTLDSDNDGVLDIQEIEDQTDPYDPCSLVIENQTEPLGIENWDTLDCDGDGVSNYNEVRKGNRDRTNGTVIFQQDTDGDGIPDYMDTDDDGDGVLTRDELPDADGDGVPDDADDTDEDGIPDYLDIDDDGDGILTRDELPDTNGDGIPDDAVDTDGDGIPDYKDIDDDGDGILTKNELPDANGDGVPDDAVDTDGDGIPDYKDTDDDGDGVLTKSELPDANGDGIPDDAVDTDGDGIPDYKDIDDDGDGILTKNELPDTNGDGVPDDAVDTDGDGVPDYKDIDDDGDGILTKNELPDTNGDGVPDDAVDTDGDGIPDYKDTDDDGDGVLTQDELPDTNGDGVPDDALDTDGDGIPDYKDTDDDGDGVPTRDELPDANGDGIPDDALDTDGDGIPNFRDLDNDGDGVPDLVEVAEGTNPSDGKDYKDSDGDEVPDYVESQEGSDLSDPSDYKDSDGDGVPDYIEEREGSVSTDSLDYLDSDGDGVPDYIQKRSLKLSVYEQVVLLWGDKDYLAAFPTQVKASTYNGVPLVLGVSWSNPETVNVYKRGTYELRGVLSLPKGIFNPYGVTGILKVIVLPKPAPLDVTLTNDIFEGSTDTFFIPVGSFVVNDPVDNIHEVILLGEGYDNGYFEVIDNILFWNSADPAPGRTTFTVIIRVTDRDGNTLDKFFEIRRTRPSVSSLTIYNTFTPNGDRYNDNWGVPGIRFYRGARIQVFERGGNRVFYTENPDVRWDGTYKGKEMPVGSYYWVIEVPETGESRRGIVNLLRK
jgi:gliding motility-associated-like protein